MKKLGRSQFNYETFKVSYDTDKKIQNIVKDFDQKTITLKTSELDDVSANAKQPNDDNTVNTMAKRATDLG